MAEAPLPVARCGTAELRVGVVFFSLGKVQVSAQVVKGLLVGLFLFLASGVLLCLV